MKIPVLALLFGLAPLGVVPLWPQDYLVLETQGGKTTRRGKTGLVLEENEVSAASTFKVVIAWAAIDLGLAKASEPLVPVNDRHVPGSPRKVALKEAMFYSSNDYFKKIAPHIGMSRLRWYVEQSGIFGKPVVKNWLDPDFNMVEKGGIMKTTPWLNHQWMIKVASGTFIKKPEVQAELEKSLFWPSPDPKIRLFGKTGTLSGAVWFNGFGKTPQGTKVVTVFIPGGIQDRPRTIQLFYEAFGLKWDDSLAKQLE